MIWLKNCWKRRSTRTNNNNNTSDALIILAILVIQTRRWSLIYMFCPAQCFGVVREWVWSLLIFLLWIPADSLSRNIPLNRETHTRRLTCIASDVWDRVRSRGQDNVTNINDGSGARRIIFKRQQCMDKSEPWTILMKICWPEMPARTHTVCLWLF